jgi:hypothetical protein
MRYSLALLLFYTTAANAAVILHDEAIDGDLSPFAAITIDTSVPLTVFALSPGENQILGTMTLRALLSIPYDYDAFAFTVPIGSQLTSLSLETSKVSGDAAFDDGAPPLPPVLGVATTGIPGSSIGTPPGRSAAPCEGLRFLLPGGVFRRLLRRRSMIDTARFCPNAHALPLPI